MKFDYFIFTCNYRHVPRIDEWKSFIDLKTIHTLQITNPPGVVKSEVDGLWQKDSLSFYSAVQINNCRSLLSTLMLGRNTDKRNDIFVCGFDTARGGSDRNKTADDFSASVFKISSDDPFRPIHVYTTRKFRIQSPEMALIIYNLYRRFRFKKIVYDPNGGGLFVIDELYKDKITVDGVDYDIELPLINHDDDKVVSGVRILVPFKRGDKYIDSVYKTSESDSILVNKMHTRLSGAIANGKIVFAANWDGWQNDGGKSNLKKKREWLNKASGSLDTPELIKAEMDMAVSQLINVDIARNRKGEPLLDKWNMYRFIASGGGNKKDSAYSLAYAYTGCLIEQYLMFGKKKKEERENLILSSCAY
jgi:hypothetical protein